MPTVDIYSDSDDDIIPATPDIASDTSSDDVDKRVESKKLKNIEKKIADTNITEKASSSREQILTGSEWLKLIESRRGKQFVSFAFKPPKHVPLSCSGGSNTESVQNLNGSPQFRFLMVFGI